MTTFFKTRCSLVGWCQLTSCHSIYLQLPRVRTFNPKFWKSQTFLGHKMVWIDESFSLLCKGHEARDVHERPKEDAWKLGASSFHSISHKLAWFLPVMDRPYWSIFGMPIFQSQGHQIEWGQPESWWKKNHSSLKNIKVSCKNPQGPNLKP